MNAYVLAVGGGGSISSRSLGLSLAWRINSQVSGNNNRPWWHRRGPAFVVPGSTRPLSTGGAPPPPPPPPTPATPSSTSSASSTDAIAEKAEAFANLVANAKYAVLSSTSDNPFVNLSIEHYLLQNSRPDSVILFNYVNRPCVVIGRNQNPWLEVNLECIDVPAPLQKWKADFGHDRVDHAGYVDLVRRRSGGGTVFHDEGNINYSVICPKDTFTRDKYVEMVVRGLRSLSARVRVNERHDIVMDQGPKARFDIGVEPSDTHRTLYEDPDRTPLKVSGSAFKMTRQRAMHHGTCLLHSPNLSVISKYLRSPAAPYIKALGVDSVRSPVGNVAEHARDTAISEFREAITREFFEMHNIRPDMMASKSDEKGRDFDKYRMVKLPGYGEDLLFGWTDEDHAQLPQIRKGMEEMANLDWVYGQTPRFTFSSHPTSEDPRERALPDVIGSAKPQVSLSLKHGAVDEAHVAWSDDSNAQEISFGVTKEEQKDLVGMKLYEIEQLLPALSVSAELAKKLPNAEQARQELSRWLTKTLVDPAGLYQDKEDG